MKNPLTCVRCTCKVTLSHGKVEGVEVEDVISVGAASVPVEKFITSNCYSRFKKAKQYSVSNILFIANNPDRLDCPNTPITRSG